jgi:uncharacterized DUF497 family protein
MNELRFEREERKNRENKRKHRISFEEAQTAFYDANAMVYADPEESQIPVDRHGGNKWAWESDC